MNKELFTPFPCAAIEGKVQWQNLLTSKLEKLHTELLNRNYKTLSEASTGKQHLLSYGYIEDQEEIKQKLEDLGIEHWFGYICRNHGAYTFVPCPFDKREGQLIYSAGFLFYNEYGKLYWIAFYVGLALIYESYLNRCKAEPAGFSIGLCWSELLLYILPTCIPRLIRQNLPNHLQK